MDKQKIQRMPIGRHSERTEDEVFLGWFEESYIPNIGWNTKRLGTQRKKNHLFPVFVKKSEILETGEFFIKE